MHLFVVARAGIEPATFRFSVDHYQRVSSDAGNATLAATLTQNGFHPIRLDSIVFGL